VLSFLVSFLIWIFAGEPKRHIRDGQKVVEASREDPVANHDGPLAAFASCASLHGESSGAQEHLPEECETRDNGHPYRHRQDASRVEVLLRPHKEGDLLPNRSTGGTLVYGVRVGGVVAALYQPEGPAHLS